MKDGVSFDPSDTSGSPFKSALELKVLLLGSTSLPLRSVGNFTEIPVASAFGCITPTVTWKARAFNLHTKMLTYQGRTYTYFDKAKVVRR
jgi:hypothetical protein